MKLIIVSDNHGNRKILDEITERYIDKVDKFVHCGDSEMTEDSLIWNIMDTVSGNCDYYGNFKSIHVEKETEYPYVVVHGHQHNVKSTLDQLKELAQENQVQFVFYGHTHILKVDYEDDIFFLNPGSIQSPRGALKEKTYCLLEVNNGRVLFRFFDDSHEELLELSQEWNLTEV